MAELLERNGNKVKFKVVVPAKEVSDAYTGVFNALSRQVKIPGFRPGKAPKGVIEKRVGEDFVKNEVGQELVKRTYGNAVSELKLAPVSANVTMGEIAENTEFEFTVDAENYPEVTLPNWEAFTLEAAAPTIGDEDVTNAIEEVRQSRADYENVDRAIEASDLANVEILEGEDAGKTYPVYLERAEEGVRAALLGKIAGDEADVQLGGAEDDDEDSTLKVRVSEVKAKNVPALDEEFIKGLNIEGVENHEQLLARVKVDLEAQAVQKGVTDRKDEFIKKLGEGAILEIPEIMIENRREALEVDLGRDLENQGVTLDAYKKYLEVEGKLEEFEKDITTNATTRVRNDLALEKLTEILEVSLTEDEWKAALAGYAQANRVSVPRLLEALGKDGLENYRTVVTRDKALETAIARISK
jgi:trigger factor